jgi:hypothetical protein
MLNPPKKAPVAFVALLLAACPPTLANAQCPPPPAASSLAEGEIGIFFDPLGTVTCGNPIVLGSTPLYVVARVPAGGLDTFSIPEVRAMNSVAANMLIGPSFLPEDSPFLWVFNEDGCDQGVRPFETTCPVAQGDLIVIAQLSVLLPVAMTGTACFETVCSSVIGTVPATPFYTTCNGASDDFTGSEMMCIGLGEAPVPVETTTWGAVKAIYR